MKTFVLFPPRPCSLRRELATMADTHDGKAALKFKSGSSVAWAESRAASAVLRKGMERAHTGPSAFSSQTFTTVDENDYVHTEDRAFSPAEISLAK